MYINDILTLIATALIGSLIGNLLFISLIYKTIIQAALNDDQRFYTYQRLYRFNTAMPLIAGILAALTNYRQAALMFTILAASNVFARMHLLQNIYKLQTQGGQQQQIRGLQNLQNLTHILQIIGAAYGIFLLL